MISKVIKTSSSSNLLRYIEDKHAHNNELTDQRNLLLVSQNLGTIDGKHDAGYDIAQFNAVQQRAKNKRKKTKAYHLIFSFSDDEFPVTNDAKELQEQAVQASALIYRFLQEQLDKDSQFILGVQRDGKGKKLHVHVALNSVLMNGKVLNTNQIRLLDRGEEQGLRSNLDDFMKDQFEEVTKRSFKPIAQKTDNLVNASEIHIKQREQAKKKNAYGWKEHLKNTIYQAFSASDSLEDFKQKLEQSNVIITERRQRINNDSKKKQYRKAFTYTYMDDNKKTHKIRDFAINKRGGIRGLGKSFTPDSLQKEFEIKNDNLKKQRIRQDQSTIKSTAQSIRQLANELIDRTSTSDSRLSASRSEQADATKPASSIFANIDTTRLSNASKKLSNDHQTTKRNNKPVNLPRERKNIQLVKLDRSQFRNVDNEYIQYLEYWRHKREKLERQSIRTRDLDANVNDDSVKNTTGSSTRNWQTRQESNRRNARKQQEIDENPFE